MKRTLILTAALVAMMTTTVVRAAEFGPVKPHCNVKVVSYIFTGTPGASFEYNGKAHALPSDGRIEIIANQKDLTYHFAGSALAIDPEAKRDSFGSVEVTLGTSQVASATTAVQMASR